MGSQCVVCSGNWRSNPCMAAKDDYNSFALRGQTTKQLRPSRLGVFWVVSCCVFCALRVQNFVANVWGAFAPLCKASSSAGQTPPRIRCSEALWSAGRSPAPPPIQNRACNFRGTRLLSTRFVVIDTLDRVTDRDSGREGAIGWHTSCCSGFRPNDALPSHPLS